MTEPSPEANPPTKEQNLTSPIAAQVRNLLIVLVAIALSTAVFLGLRTEATGGSLQALAASATPLEVALGNGKPSLMEFYADWCTSCQAMAKDMTELEIEFGDRVNFVMLNVDNSKWLPELLQYRVDGIPHFVFLNQTGEAIASTIGEQPKLIMATNLEALLSGASLPYAQSKGRVSDLDTAVVPKTGNDDPRSHGSQVVK
jgi:thiol-disulfide isomerase/thioredoxin